MVVVVVVGTYTVLLRFKGDESLLELAFVQPAVAGLVQLMVVLGDMGDL